MDFLAVLLDLRLLRSVVVGASNRTGALRRRLWLSRVTSLVNEAVQQRGDQFKESLPGGDHFLRALCAGNFEIYDALVVPELPLSSPGRVVATLALVVYLLNHLDSETQEFEPGFLCDRLIVPLWRKARTMQLSQRR